MLNLENKEILKIEKCRKISVLTFNIFFFWCFLLYILSNLTQNILDILYPKYFLGHKRVRVFSIALFKWMHYFKVWIGQPFRFLHIYYWLIDSRVIYKKKKKKSLPEFGVSKFYILSSFFILKDHSKFKKFWFPPKFATEVFLHVAIFIPIVKSQWFLCVKDMCHLFDF